MTVAQKITFITLDDKMKALDVLLSIMGATTVGLTLRSYLILNSDSQLIFYSQT